MIYPKKPRIRKRSIGLTEIVVGSLLVTVVFSVIVYVFRLTASVTEVEAVPLHTINLQLVDACGVGGMAQSIADRLTTFSDADIAIEVIEISSFKRQGVAESIIVSREDDKSAAETLAAKVGLDPSTVEYRPLENNSQQISVTLVIGDDYERIKLALESTEEI